MTESKTILTQREKVAPNRNPEGKAIVLNFDDSVILPDYIRSLDLRSLEEKIRYVTSWKEMDALEHVIKDEAADRRLFFLGNGDFHHVSYLLIKVLPHEGLHVVVLDNHTDNMFLPHGIHCGSWVYHTSKLPNVSRVSVFGIASGDLLGLDLIQNRFSVVRSGKVEYYSLSPVGLIAKLLSGYRIKDLTLDKGDYADTLRKLINNDGGPVYLSIDKDVLLRSVVRTTWDQGRMSLDELIRCVGELAPYTVAADVVGDVSFHDYLNPIKRLMNRLDKKEGRTIALEEQRLLHTSINMKLLTLLCESRGAELSRSF